jgi:hypothetical protein
MKIINTLLNYVKKNKKTFSLLLILDLIFIIVFAGLIVYYIPLIADSVSEFNELMAFVGPNEEDSLLRLASQSDVVLILEREMRILYLKLIGGILIAGNIIFGLFFSLYFKNLKSKYIFKFIGLNFLLQGLLWLIFKLVVNVKSFAINVGILSDKSIQSVLLFVLIVYLVYLLGIILMVELRNNSVSKAFKSSIKLLKKSWLVLSLRYLALIVCFWVLLVIIQMPVFPGLINVSRWQFLFSFFIGFSIFIFYLTLSKIFFIESIIQFESKR